MFDTETIYTRHPDFAPWQIDARIIPFIQRARLYDFHLIAYGRVDQDLVMALVEWWRQETHTFYLLLGEATITLLNVFVLTRLPIEGHAVCTVGPQLYSWQDIVHRVLGVRPPSKVSKGSRLRVTWLAQNFLHLPEGADEATVRRISYILLVLSCSPTRLETGYNFCT